MATPCQECGAEPRDGARFCDACGSPIATAATHAEYKQVTVLFADVVHSMDIAAAVGAERLREIMGELFNRSSAIVKRYGGTVDKFTGDGIMAVFGAPVALEDHAVRACRAAMDIQAEVASLDLQLRVGLNSGEVITGEIGPGPLAYTAVGEQVGMAQRMESVAPSGGVMVSESTARLVENAAVLSDAELVYIKGVDDPVPARRLLGMATERRANRVETRSVGREWEIGALRGLVDRAVTGSGSVVGVVGPPGIGKSRTVRETVSHAASLGIEVFTTHCESHTIDIPFHAAAGLVRSATGSIGLDHAAARQKIASRFVGAAADDLCLLYDLLGIADPAGEPPLVDPDARRRRLTAMINAATLLRTTPVVYVIEDAHWIDSPSESMLTEFLAVVLRTPSLVLITYRPEYVGTLAHTPRSQTIALEPLDDKQMSALTADLLGGDRSVASLSELVSQRAAGNPFFAEEIVRDLTERDVVVGGRGCYLCPDPVADVTVPSTLQAVIAARIDRLNPAAKRTLNAAAVIGSRFDAGTLEALSIEPVLDDLVRAELIDQTAFGVCAEYAFRHPLVRAVAYESQLKSDRAGVHRRLAAALDQEDQNAALIAEHLEAAGDLTAAYEWHMRAGAWSTNRDTSAAIVSWDRARQIADALPEDHANRLAMRIAPRTLLCGNGFRSQLQITGSRFDELRDLCAMADDKSSLAIGMAGLMGEHFMQGRVSDAADLAAEHAALIESVADPGLIVGVSVAPIAVSVETGNAVEALRWSQKVIDIAQGDSGDSGIIIGAPVAAAFATRCVARWGLGQPGWPEDMECANKMARSADAMSHGLVLAYTYGMGISNGVILAVDSVVDELEEGLRLAERSSDDIALGFGYFTLALALLHRAPQDRNRGVELMMKAREMCMNQQYYSYQIPYIDACIARERIRGGDREGAFPVLRDAVETLLAAGLVNQHVQATKLLVGALVDRGGEKAFDEAEAAVSRLSAAPTHGPWVMRDLVLVWARARLARAHGDDATYRELRERYRTMSNDLGFEGHVAWAAAMP